MCGAAGAACIEMETFVCCATACFAQARARTTAQKAHQPWKRLGDLTVD
jgi:hypothetical protein